MRWSDRAGLEPVELAGCFIQADRGRNPRGWVDGQHLLEDVDQGTRSFAVHFCNNLVAPLKMRQAAASWELVHELKDDDPQSPDVPSHHAGFFFLGGNIRFQILCRAHAPVRAKVRQFDVEVPADVAGVTVLDENIARVNLSMGQLSLGLVKI